MSASGVCSCLSQVARLVPSSLCGLADVAVILLCLLVVLVLARVLPSFVLEGRTVSLFIDLRAELTLSYILTGSSRLSDMTRNANGGHGTRTASCTPSRTTPYTERRSGVDGIVCASPHRKTVRRPTDVTRTATGRGTVGTPTHAHAHVPQQRPSRPHAPHPSILHADAPQVKSSHHKQMPVHTLSDRLEGR